MNDSPSTTAVLDQLERLTATHGKPFGQAVRKQAEEYAAAFTRAGLPMSAVIGAVDQAISLGKKFPSASELIERAREFVPQTDGQRNTSPEHCPHCGIVYFYAGYHFAAIPERGDSRFSRPEAVLPKMRCGCPQPDPSWWTPEALAWVEDDQEIMGHRKPRDYAHNSRYRYRQGYQRSERGGEPTRAA